MTTTEKTMKHINKHLMEKLLTSKLGFEKAYLEQKDVSDGSHSYYFFVTHYKFGAYEVHVHSNDGQNFDVYKESESGFGDLEGCFSI